MVRPVQFTLLAHPAESAREGRVAMAEQHYGCPRCGAGMTQRLVSGSVRSLCCAACSLRLLYNVDTAHWLRVSQ